VRAGHGRCVVNVLSLFSGIGGLELGLERAGMTVVGQVEIDPFCRRVLEKHWPEVPRHDDVRTAVEWWLGRARPAVDVVCGGFPCQGHSVAGRRHGTADARWGWPWMRDVISELRPRIAIIENVPNLVRTGLLDVLQDLAARGFDAWWGRIPAAALGAPHRRWRLFVIAADPERLDLWHEPGRLGWADWNATTVAGHDGSAWAVADPEGFGGELWPPSSERSGRLAGGSPCELGQHWAAEPDVGRVAHGVPQRVDRLRALGNAVVPQVAEHVGRLVMGAAS
jgi:DNA (cytosine-5)-methyltransferase 1